jgi:hypothetical protein
VSYWEDSEFNEQTTNKQLESTYSLSPGTSWTEARVKWASSPQDRAGGSAVLPKGTWTWLHSPLPTPHSTFPVGQLFLMESSGNEIWWTLAHGWSLSLESDSKLPDSASLSENNNWMRSTGLLVSLTKEGGKNLNCRIQDLHIFLHSLACDFESTTIMLVVTEMVLTKYLLSLVQEKIKASWNVLFSKFFLIYRT